MNYISLDVNAISLLDVCGCCGNCCCFAFVMWCGYCQSLFSPLSFGNRILPQHQETIKYEF